MNSVLHRNSRREEALTDLRFTIYDLRNAWPLARKSKTVNRKWLGFVAVVFFALTSFAEQRFPPPDFSETNHQLPITATPAARALLLQYLDVAVLAAALAAAVWLIYTKRSRRGVWALSIFSLAYFGFYRKGCICAIGAPQNITLGLFDPGYAVPLTALAFFALPIVVALFAGRAFCAGVCPHGAIQDLILVKPKKVPPWLEHGLGILPYVFLGAGLIYAATGTGFVICRYDPFVPLFRLTGSFFILTAGAAFLLLGMFVGRPYCRFLCPYGALLKLASLTSKWRVRVTPDYCTQCRLCENSCPFGAMREPAAAPANPRFLGIERRRLGWLLVLLPVMIAVGAALGSKLAPAAAQLNSTVELAERYVRQQKEPVQYGVQTPEALSLQRAEQDPQTILAAAENLRRRFALACLLFGGWVGLVIGVKLIALSVRQGRTDFEPDRGACFACARCFEYCPNERVRLGLMPASELPVNPATQAVIPAK
jgi:NosR/NirI family transcriptional regulator, nitrous oxide reductase regulator